MKIYRKTLDIKDMARLKGILPRPTYRKLRNRCQQIIEDQIKDYGRVSFGLSLFNGILIHNDDIKVRRELVPQLMDNILTSLGLEDDGTKTNTYTKKGYELPEIDLLRAYARTKE